MSFKKDIIVLTGGKNKGVVKLSSAIGRSGFIKGSCALDFVPRNGVLYVIGDKIAEIEVKSRDIAFEIPEFKQRNISCVLASAAPVMFGTNEKGASRLSAIAQIEEYKTKKRVLTENSETPPLDNADRKGDEEPLYDKNEPDKPEPRSEDEPEEETIDSGSAEGENKSAADSEEPIDNSNNDENNEEAMKDLKSDERKKYDVRAEAASDAADVFSVEGVNYDGSNFYQAIKPQLDEMFVCYPAEDTLNNAVPNSSWVRIDTEDDYYVVGILFDVNAPSFICYGIPGTYDVQPPDELKEMCVWLPVDIDKKYGDGYWVIYQSAVDGKIIK